MVGFTYISTSHFLAGGSRGRNSGKDLGAEADSARDADDC